MPLDPEIRKVLEQWPAIDAETLKSVDPADFRNMADAADIAMRIEKIEVEAVRELAIPVKGGEIRARLYSNQEKEGPLTVFYHGGGFVFGNVDTHDSVCRLMARESGSKVLSVDYRLAPEHKFPTAVDDAYSAYLWALDHAGDLGMDASRVALAGDSAGGNLSAVVSVRARDEGKQMPRVQALFYPVVGVDLSSQSHREFSEGYFLTGALSEWFMQQYMNTPADLMHPFFSVQNTPDLSGMPETILFTAEFDPLRDQGETFVSKLKARGNKATGIRALGMGHGFISFFEYSRSARNYLIMGSRIIGEVLSQDRR